MASEKPDCGDFIIACVRVHRPTVNKKTCKPPKEPEIRGWHLAKLIAIAEQLYTHEEVLKSLNEMIRSFDLIVYEVAGWKSPLAICSRIDSPPDGRMYKEGWDLRVCVAADPLPVAVQKALDCATDQNGSLLKPTIQSETKLFEGFTKEVQQVLVYLALRE